ncbi:MAG: Hsp33 family molecular chaperone HslO [Mariprofundus sp.]|nr:Hsp33 family molecular chaperone HslO [Mariprofundus sp.]
MAENTDQLIRFLLPEAHSRGVIIRANHLFSEANRIHGLNGQVADLFNQSLLASILLLSISKGGMRQVLQLDATSPAPLQRILVEARLGAVRGYINWQEDQTAIHHNNAGGLSDWMGSLLRLSTVRDLGVGQPYISTIEHDSGFLADHLIHYLHQSVQIRADIILHGDLAIMIEAMPGCDEGHWFSAVEAMAKIPSQALDNDTTASLLSYFDSLHCKIAGSDAYCYQCDCSPEKMAGAIQNLPQEQLATLADASGNITVSCQYCDASHIIKP